MKTVLSNCSLFTGTFSLHAGSGSCSASKDGSESRYARKAPAGLIQIGERLFGAEVGDRGDLLLRISCQCAKSPIADALRVIAGALGPTLRQPEFVLRRPPLKDPCDHIEPARDMPDGDADAIPFRVWLPV